MLAHVVQGDEYLNGKALDQRKREAFEIIHLDEVVEIDAEKFESDAQMLSEYELIIPPDNILLVFRILFIERFDKFGFNQTLFVQPLLVLKNLQSHVFLQFVVEDSQHDSERAFSKLLDNFKAIPNMLIVTHYVFLLVVVKSVISLFINFSISSSPSIWLVPRVSVLLAFSHWEEINGVRFEDLTPFHFPQVGCQHSRGFFGGHGETDVILALGKHRGGLGVLRDSTHFGRKLGAVRGN